MRFTDNTQKQMRSVGPRVAIHCKTNDTCVEIERGSVKPEVLICTHYLHEAWNRIGELVEKPDLDFLEGRSGHPTKKGLEVSTSSLK
jgi:hypothetical protein